MKLKNNLFRSTAAIIATLLALSFTGCGQNPIISESPSSTGVVSESTASSEQTAGGSVDGSFTIHFLDVGQADSALITCDGHSMLIDGGNVDDSNVLYSVMQRETDGHLDYVVGTHAHEDHIGGLSGAFEAVTADMTLCPVTEYDSKAFRDFASYAEQKGGGITIPDVGETYTLGEAEFTIVGVNSVPDDTNNTSIVLRIVYGDTSFLFTGDAEQEAENVILASGQDIQSTVLKVGHSANNVFIEVTRRCNMCCAHCLRGDAESIDIQEKYIDAFLDNFEKGAYISSLTFTGGEISLNIPAIRYTLKAVKERGIAVGSFYMVTNGKAVDKMADLAMASLEWWAYCDEKDDYMCGLCISSDNFHEVIPYESKSILSGLKYNRNDKVTDFHLTYLLNEGRAKNLDSNIYKKREPHVDKFEYEFNKTGDIDFYSGELYLNAIGDVVSGCDWSYKSQKKYRFGNVMNKNWLENISNSELYIAS